VIQFCIRAAKPKTRDVAASINDPKGGAFVPHLLFERIKSTQ
jgi:hypothetical protein